MSSFITELKVILYTFSIEQSSAKYGQMRFNHRHNTQFIQTVR